MCLSSKSSEFADGLSVGFDVGHVAVRDNPKN